MTDSLADPGTPSKEVEGDGDQQEVLEEAGRLEEGTKDAGKHSLKSPIKMIRSLAENTWRPKNEEQEFETPIPEDIFSLLYLCEFWSWAAFYALFVYAIQMGIIILILLDLIDGDSEYNPLKVPPGVPIQVTIAQGTAMVLAVATQTNLLLAISRMALGSSYDHEYVLSIYPHATRTTYRLSYTLQFLAGAAMLAAIFTLNMQSTTVLGLMLNFAALAFVSEIQEVAFWVANHGYISVRIQEATRLVTNFTIPRQHRKHTNTLVKRFFFILMVGVLLTFFGLLAYNQRSGRFICDKLMVQFGDDFRPDLTFYSGIYIKKPHLISDRAVYEDERGKGAVFSYCAKDKVWTFTGPFDPSAYEIDEYGNVTVPDAIDDPCKYWMKSPQTESYDILETDPMSWHVVDYFSNQTPRVDHFLFSCNDCSGHRATHSCSDLGTCRNNECDCSGTNRIGVNCEYRIPCPKLELDLRTEPFPYAEGGMFVPATSYDLLLNNESEPIMVYNKPVFVGFLTSNKVALNLIMFTGRRWGLFLNFDFLDATEIQQLKPGLPSYLPEDFHTWFSRHRVYFFSDAMDLGSASDFSSPIDLPWYRSRELVSVPTRTLYRVDSNQPTNTVLLCPSCLAYNDCFNEGYCTIKDKKNGTLKEYLTRVGSCECKYGFEGYLCEKELNCFSPNVTCLNGGNCTTDGSCSCLTHYTGKLCQYEIDQAFVDLLELD